MLPGEQEHDVPGKCIGYGLRPDSDGLPNRVQGLSYLLYSHVYASKWTESIPLQPILLLCKSVLLSWFKYFSLQMSSDSVTHCSTNRRLFPRE
jgi:hypothetical protein